MKELQKPSDVDRSTLLGVCASMKPAPGLNGRSAARSLLVSTLDLLSRAYPHVSLLDLRERPLPFFDGRMPLATNSAEVGFAWTCVDRAGALLLSVPAYWSGVSGVFKNFVDTLCGPAYDMEGPVTTVFSGKPVGLLIVGADAESTRAGGEDAWRILESTGAEVLGEPVLVSNPRRGIDPSVTRSLVELAGSLGQRVVAGNGGAGP
jgi:NAD(P)H-dependent FMN reductase